MVRVLAEGGQTRKASYGASSRLAAKRGGARKGRDRERLESGNSEGPAGKEAREEVRFAKWRGRARGKNWPRIPWKLPHSGLAPRLFSGTPLGASIRILLAETRLSRRAPPNRRISICSLPHVIHIRLPQPDISHVCCSVTAETSIVCMRITSLQLLLRHSPKLLRPLHAHRDPSPGQLRRPSTASQSVCAPPAGSRALLAAL